MANASLLIKGFFTAPFLAFGKNLDRGACQVKNLKREKLSDFLGLTDIFLSKI